MIAKKIFLLQMIYFWFIPAQKLFSAAHVTVRGSLVNNNLGLNTQANNSVSASLSFDVGSVFRVGLTHRQAFSKISGYRLNEVNQQYDFQIESNYSIANSADFTVILYFGKLFVPYLQIGLVKKEYILTSELNDNTPNKSKYVMPVVPNGGMGLGIRLNKDFSLKISYTVSQGIRQTDPDADPVGVFDDFTSIGLSYTI